MGSTREQPKPHLLEVEIGCGELGQSLCLELLGLYRARQYNSRPGTSLDRVGFLS